MVSQRCRLPVTVYGQPTMPAAGNGLWSANVAGCPECFRAGNFHRHIAFTGNFGYRDIVMGWFRPPHGFATCA
jgi:hypothetical protein